MGGVPSTATKRSPKTLRDGPARRASPQRRGRAGGAPRGARPNARLDLRGRATRV